MPHSPPVPPGNQSPYPMVEKPHDRHGSTPAVATTVDRKPKNAASSGNGLRNGIAAALGIGAVAALIAGIVAATRQSPDRPAPRRKPNKARKNRN